jgi:HNH endonuclease
VGNARLRCRVCDNYRLRGDFVRPGLCSQECVDESYRKTKKPSRRKEIPADVRQAVYERDNHRCRYCGTRRALHAHHVLYRSELGPDELDNLITLCLVHHGLVHSNKGLWQPLCLAYITHVAAGHHLTLPQLKRRSEGGSGPVAWVGADWSNERDFQ